MSRVLEIDPRIHRATLLTVLALGSLLLLAGCARKSPQVAGAADPRMTDVAPGSDAGAQGTAADATEAPADRIPELGPIFFDFDRYDLRDDAREQLADNVEYLLRNPRVRVRIEGHCDEFGTHEYNLALGDRRASVARDFLVAKGVEADRLSTVSYGEERPLCPDSNTRCWPLNRRSHFAVAGD